LICQKKIKKSVEFIYRSLDKIIKLMQRSYLTGMGHIELVEAVSSMFFLTSAEAAS